MRLWIELHNQRIALWNIFGRTNEEYGTTRAGLRLEGARRGRLRQAAAFARDENVARLIQGDGVQNVVTLAAQIGGIVETAGGIDAREESIADSAAKCRLQGVRGDR